MEQSDVCNIIIPKLDALDEYIEMRTGDILFVLGANGTGKSGLMHCLNKQNSDKTCWIRSTRQTFFGDKFNMLRSKQVKSAEVYIQSSEKQYKSRFVDEHVSDKPNIVISKFMRMIQKQNAELSRFTRLEGGTASTYWKENKSLLDRLNHILCKVNLPVVAEEIGDNEDVLVCNSNGDKYDIAQLSDGERTAVLIAAEIITVPPNTLVLIDEPERHLHRSIISPLMQELFSERPDCCFIISTHDITLPTDNPKSRTLLVRDCKYNDGVPQKWVVDLIEPNKKINKEIMMDILGASRKLLFVEGENDKLDSQFYSAIFTDVSVIPKGSFADVKHAVKGIRNSEEFCWPEVYGLVDRDERKPEDVKKLEESRIYSLPVCAVESLYYSQKMVGMVVKHTPHLKSTEYDDHLKKVREETVKAFSNSIDSLGKRSVELKIRSKVLEQIPNHRDDVFNKSINIDLNPEQMLKDELEEIRKIVDNNDFDAMIADYPIKHTTIPSCIVGVLGMKMDAYEQTVCNIIRDHQDVKDYVAGMLGKLYKDITVT